LKNKGNKLEEHLQDKDKLERKEFEKERKEKSKRL